MKINKKWSWLNKQKWRLKSSTTAWCRAAWAVWARFSAKWWTMERWEKQWIFQRYLQSLLLCARMLRCFDVAHQHRTRMSQTTSILCRVARVSSEISAENLLNFESRSEVSESCDVSGDGESDRAECEAGEWWKSGGNSMENRFFSCLFEVNIYIFLWLLFF